MSIQDELEISPFKTAYEAFKAVLRFHRNLSRPEIEIRLQKHQRNLEYLLKCRSKQR
jgi:hypothetical protein